MHDFIYIYGNDEYEKVDKKLFNQKKWINAMKVEINLSVYQIKEVQLI